MDTATGARLIEVGRRIVDGFESGHWEELGLLVGASDIIDGHPRLLRSLSWGDEDYSGNVLTVVKRIVERDPRTLATIESYLDSNWPADSTFVSAKPAERRITFAPYVFSVPDGYPELDLVAVMMPFAMEFDGVHAAIQEASQRNGLRCLRVDDLWEESVIIQDIFNLIFRAQVVVVDFTGKNPNVMYETGIAHTLGKHVVPISQSLDDIPFDMRHHRTLRYLANEEGLTKLVDDLSAKLSQFQMQSPDTIPSGKAFDDDDLPF